jgi:hypothetical protein
MVGDRVRTSVKVERTKEEKDRTTERLTTPEFWPVRETCGASSLGNRLTEVSCKQQLGD